MIDGLNTCSSSGSAWNNGTTNTTYGYDASGNRTSVGAATYSYDARNQLISDGASTYTYSARGTLTSQITGATVTPTTTDAYSQVATRNGRGHTYDALGRALTDTATGTTTFAYSGASNLIASDGANTYSYDPAGALLGIGNAAAGGGTTAGTGTFAFVDQHTDLVGRFTATGTALAGSTAYDPWGKPTSTVSPQGRLGYQSGWTDPSGLVDMAARWYNPTVGQFNDRDTLANNPIPTSVDANPFTYGSDAPSPTPTQPATRMCRSAAGAHLRRALVGSA